MVEENTPLLLVNDNKRLVEEEETAPVWRQVFAEFMGTAMFVFIGTASMISVTASGLSTLLGAAFGHGFGLASVIFAVGAVSGGHVNPAVTAATMATRRMKFTTGLLFIVAQLLGALMGSGLVDALLPEAAAKGVAYGSFAISADITTTQAFFLEALMTAGFVTVIFSVGVQPESVHRAALAPLAIGFALFAYIWAGGFYTGTCLNPARYFGPAVVAGSYSKPVVYLLGPVLGGLIGGFYQSHILHPAYK